MMYELTKRVSRRYDLQYYIVLIAHLVRLAFFLFLFPVKFTSKTRRFSKFFCRNLSPFLPFPCLLLLVSLTTGRKHVFLFRSIVVVGHRIIFRFRSLSRLLRVLSLSFPLLVLLSRSLAGGRRVENLCGKSKEFAATNRPETTGSRSPEISKRCFIRV